MKPVDFHSPLSSSCPYRLSGCPCQVAIDGRWDKVVGAFLVAHGYWLFKDIAKPAGIGLPLHETQLMLDILAVAFCLGLIAGCAFGWGLRAGMENANSKTRGKRHDDWPRGC